MSKLTDKDYHIMSQAAYGKNPPGLSEKMPGWEVVEPKGATLDDPISGFDATVYRNPETNQIVVAYRGTEPDSVGFINDAITDAKDVVGGRYKDLEETFNAPLWKQFAEYANPFNTKSYILDRLDYETNQFHRADQLITNLKEKYPDASIDVTGHSLGGALAQYSAAKHDLNAITFSAPSVYNLLPDDLQAYAESGFFDKQIINYVHPSDSIGAGFGKEYDRHIGSTYYLGDKSFDQANEKYDYLGGNLIRAKDTVSGTNYHGLGNYKFDKDGYLSNVLYNRHTGEILTGSPLFQRHLAASEFFDVFKSGELFNALSSTLGAAGAFAMGAIGARLMRSGLTIRIDPDEVMEVGKQLKQHALQFEQECPVAIRTINSLLSNSESRRFSSIAASIRAELEQTASWYVHTTTDIASYLEKKSTDFIIADRGVSTTANG
ncbi:lipase family protein [Brevibacillus daliensis]|uniref:lipase family protein n=1 Tax=Brevibacillus daliensis TaxID=2892995 RepID=UPI001E380472|nr:hypothetical protein [Brevibacillus daliensis]